MDETLLSPLRDTEDAPGPDWAAMETRLLAVLQEQSGTDAARPNGAVPTRHATMQWRWLSVAALLVLAAAITYYTDPYRGPSTSSSPPRSGPVGVAAPVSERPPAIATPPTTRNQPLPAQPTSPPSDRTVRTATRTRAATEVRSSTSPTLPSSLNDFVMLPNAAGLPALESGRIVRVEVPLASLPAYGLHLVPDATPDAVEADFLVGQDGIPRAIRLATYPR